MTDFGENGFVVFGGFVKGTRVNQLVGFERNIHSISGDVLQDGSQGCNPLARASHTSAVYNDRLYVFGGQDDDNNKLGDLWAYDFTSSVWSEVKQADDADYKPTPRSGHTACVYGNKMYIFGGILELTKELNEMVVFDFNTMQFTKSCDGEYPNQELRLEAQKTSLLDTNTHSPTRKTLAHGLSPVRPRPSQKNFSPGRSPTKKRKGTSPPKKVQDTTTQKEGLSSPTSVSMQNSFIIKNADESFDVYYHSMKKRKHMSMIASEQHA